MIKEKSLKLNMILNTVRGALKVLFPLITFPYISKVLGVEAIGAYNFATSYVTYFVYIANLGITDYGTREAAYVREDKTKFEQIISEIYSINFISLLVSYFLLVLSLLLFSKIREYYILILILSLDIPLRVIGVEWVFGAKEDYTYITIRSILFQLVSIVLLFIFVHKPEDGYLYAAITVISSAGSNLLNRIKVRDFCKIRLTKNTNFKKHIKPLMLIFATSIASTIYVNSDVTLLGLICGDSEVGIYSVAVKVYTIMKTLLASTFVVAVPRMSAYFKNNELEDFDNVGRNVFEILSTFMIPAIVGMVVLSKQIVLIVSTPEYLFATQPLAILSIALFFSLGSWFVSYCVLIPTGNERFVFVATIISAVTNLILNLILLKAWGATGAAITTLVSESICFFIVIIKGRDFIDYIKVFPTIIKIIIGSIPIFIISIFVKLYVTNLYLYTVSVVIVSIIIYFGIEIVLKNQALINFLTKKKNYY